MSVTKTCRDISELKEVAQTACNLFLSECKAVGLDIFITETYRSQERQNYLYEQGRTRAGQKVTWTKNSRHTSRLAWDIACNKPSLYDVATLKKAGSLAKKLGITWGGDWNTPDMPHFEVTATWKAPSNVVSTASVKEDKKESVNMTDNKTQIVSAFAKEAQKWVQENGISDGSRPQDPITRQEAWVMLQRLASKSLNQ